MMNKPQENPGPGDSRAYESSEVRIGPLIAAGLLVAVIVVVSTLLMSGMFNFFASRNAAQHPSSSPMADSRKPPPGPLLQPDPSKELADARAYEEALIGRYTWVERDSGIVRIPVEKAMELLAKRGLPVRKQGEVTE